MLGSGSVKDLSALTNQYPDCVSEQSLDSTTKMNDVEETLQQGKEIEDKAIKRTIRATITLTR